MTSPAPTASDEATPAPLTQLWRTDITLRTLLIANALNTLGRGVFFTLTALYLTLILGFDALQVGLALTIAGGVGVVFSLLGGHLADRLSSRTMLIVSAAIQGLGLCAYTLISGYWMLLLIASITMAAQQFGSSVRSAAIGRAFTGDDRVRIRAGMYTVTNVGIGIGTAIAAIPLAIGTGGAYRLTMVLSGLLLVAGAFSLRGLEPERVDRRAAPEPVAAGEGGGVPDGAGSPSAGDVAVRAEDGSAGGEAGAPGADSASAAQTTSAAQAAQADPAALTAPAAPRPVPAAADPTAASSSAKAAARRPRSPYRDARYLLLTLLNGAFSIQFGLFGVAVPLWVVNHTEAPSAAVSVLLIINTAVVASLSVRLSRGAGDLPGAARAMARAGWLMAAACGLWAWGGFLPLWLALVVLVAAAIAHSLAEVLSSAAGWAMSYELAPPEQMGAYQGVFGTGFALSNMIAPVVVTVTAVNMGPLGWGILAVGFLACALGVVALVKAARRQG
ncbi:MFS transporter [Galactobacter valiniphilus]|uniref:MFS transporter n=1 Tax=Galactobacter valiniphilus TaxID=2676122 RepID=A0A399JDB6_9MICC|nr:MFS transporter [Galactobacter valiniphilus]RII42249.1 MFS transporter [Galactobacter valiniphilus]